MFCQTVAGWLICCLEYKIGDGIGKSGGQTQTFCKRSDGGAYIYAY